MCAYSPSQSFGRLRLATRDTLVCGKRVKRLAPQEAWLQELIQLLVICIIKLRANTLARVSTTVLEGLQMLVFMVHQGMVVNARMHK